MSPVQPLRVRQLTEADLEAVGEILFEAFGGVYAERGFRSPFPSIDAGAWLARSYLDLDPAGAVVAIRGNRIDGIGFAHMRGKVTSIGPVAARPAVGTGAGRAVMERLLEIAESSGARAVRLFQDAFNPGSFALYAQLGFEPKDVVSYAVADPSRDRAKSRITSANGVRIREIKAREIDAAIELDHALTGADRRVDFQLILQSGRAYGLFREADLAGYLFIREGASRVALAPGAARELADLVALVAHATHAFAGRSVSARISSSAIGLMQGMLELGFRVDHLGNLMVRGDLRHNGHHLYAMFPESL
jgi:predicted N-acetyltransferase YhbS